MNNTPLVSVVIPVYNGSNYLGEAIDSALAQTYSNIEIIVVNDGSNDDGLTEAVALSYGDKIRYISKPNGGVSSALNTGISHMNGEYFSWLSHDDKYTSTKIEKQVQLLQKHDNKKTIALCESRFIDKESKIMLHQSKDRFSEEKIEWMQALLNLFSHGTYNGCALLIPKKCFDECGLFDEQLRFAQDTLMWSKILLSECNVVYDTTIGVLSRIHEKQQTHKLRHLLEHDGLIISEYVVQRLVDINYKQAIYALAKRNAKLNNRTVVKMCVKRGKIRGLKRLAIWLLLLYGKVRPFIRKIYYTLFRRIKV